MAESPGILDFIPPEPIFMFTSSRPLPAGAVRSALFLPAVMAAVLAAWSPAQTYPVGLEPYAVYSATSLGMAGTTGGLAFTPNGATLVVGGGANSASSGTLWSFAVTRDPATQRVTGLGTPTLLGPAPNIDGGLALLGSTWFYSQYPTNSVGQFNGVGSTSSPLPAALQSTGGLTFVPAGYPNGGTLLVSSYGQGPIYSVTYAAAGGGFYSIGTETLYASLAGGTEGLAFITAGPFAGDLLVADYAGWTVSIIDIDPLTGLPVGGAASPAVTTLITNWAGSEGVAIDPVTGDLWLTNFGDQILHVVGITSLNPLEADATSVSVLNGASVGFQLRAGTANAFRDYVLVGTFSGTTPGTPVGSTVVPINVDPITQLILANLNSPLFSGFLGTLDANGAAGATLNIPPGLVFQGPVPSDFAYLLFTPAPDFASNPWSLTLLP